MASLKERVWRHKALSVALGLALVLGTVLSYLYVGPLGSFGAQAGPAQMQAAPLTGSGRISPKQVNLQTSNTMPQRTAAERADLERRMASKHNDVKNPIAKPTTHYSPQANTPALNPAAGGPQANPDLTAELLNSNASGGVCATHCATSSIMETSVAANGKYIMETGNWFTALSNTNGASWGYYDPYTVDGAGFCCDQQVIYEPSRDRFFWETLYYGGLGNAVNRLDLWALGGSTFGGCVYQLTPTVFGLPSGTLMDYPQVEYATDNVYVTWNAYNGSGAFVSTYIARFDMTAMAACGSVPYGYYNDPGVFSFALADGATDTMYFASHGYLSGGNFQTHIRLYFWTDRTSTLNVGDFAIDPFNWLNEGVGNCASSDGVVTNWCARADSRRGAAYRSRAGYKGKGSPLLGFAWNVAADGSHGAYPYIVREYFNLYNVTYQGHEDFWCNNCALLYPSIAVAPLRGYVGGSVAWGGGSPNGTHYYPSTGFFFLESPDAKSQYGAYCFCLSGSANTTSAGNWGDYTTTRGLSPDGLHFISGQWAVNGSNVPVPYVTEFGQARDHNAYLRWANS